jgi:glycosyltransferase involved in cell wall biosynthesis
MRVVHVSPTYFDSSSIVGGGERYTSELALAMSRRVQTTLVTFSNKRRSFSQDGLNVEVFPVKRFIHGNKVNPMSFRHLAQLCDGDIVHVHHVHTLVSDLTCLAAAVTGKRAFVTDYGGGGSLTLSKRIPVFDGYRNAVAYSQFGLEALPPKLKKKAVLIKGGIDTRKFRPNGSKREETILFVGRLLPHKGVDYLIEGFRRLSSSAPTLRIIGRVYDETYYERLRNLAAGLKVDFVHDADDERLIHEYQTARVTVLPSVHRSYNGSYSAVPELMGFTLLESQACGTPVICTDAGAMHEFVSHRQTGLIAKANSAEALSAALDEVLSTSKQIDYSGECREWVKPFDWSRIVDSHLSLYAGAVPPATIDPDPPRIP